MSHGAFSFQPLVVPYSTTLQRIPVVQDWEEMEEVGIVHPASYNSPPYPANSKLRKDLSRELLGCTCSLNGKCAPKLMELQQTAELN